MPVGDEVSHGVEGGTVVVDLNQVRGQAGRGAVDEHDRDMGVQPGMVVAGRPGHGHRALRCLRPITSRSQPGSRRVLVTSTDRP